MKIAILLSGYLRGFYENITRFKENVIQDNDCDIYIHFTNSTEEKYYNKVISIEYIKKTLSPKLILVSDNFKFSEDTILNNLLLSHSGDSYVAKTYTKLGIGARTIPSFH
jgi:hypothetical protein